ncbi:MAG: mannose-1-phosphate guanylyltransferase/mannose-6-phosphate isomerase [Thiotrichales bacterium]|nr:mannose-1-phosphate guanylyltransferase/mannose-6-phosphate isomerase [Thiotrichales bacterium]
MSHSVVPVILSGGAGTRLWPLSREHYPKQLIALLDDDTLLQATARRLAFVEDAQPPIVVCNEAHRFIVAEQLRAAVVSPVAIILEPLARNTAPAVAAAALEALARCKEDDDPLLLILPSDHIIGEDTRFASAVRRATMEAARGRLVAFGVVPTYVETGYGYIMADDSAGTRHDARPVERFREKPDAETAAAWIEAGGCYWNSGMFVFSARCYLRELAVHAPAIHDAVTNAYENAVPDLGFLRLEAESFRQSPAISVDYAVMEHTTNTSMVPLDAGWRDIGSWKSLAEFLPPDDAGNVVRGDAVVQRTRNTFIHGDARLVATLGVADLVIVDTADAVLVADRNAAQDVKAVVRQLERADRDEHKTHRRVHRPWGSYDSVHEADGFKIKLITIQPSQKLSLQAHRHRAEHWIVVRGTAQVTCDGETFLVHENQSTFIPKGARHRLENPGETLLELIEVQTGHYLEEDDIVRFEDAYGRAVGQTVPDSPEPSE